VHLLARNRTGNRSVTLLCYIALETEVCTGERNWDPYFMIVITLRSWREICI